MKLYFMRTEKDSLIAYFDEINRRRLLDKKTEIELRYKIKEQDKLEDKNELIESYLWYVVKIARFYQNKGLPLSDLIGEGNLGLIDAVNCDDPTRGTNFDVYASYWIKRAIKRALKRERAKITVPLYILEMIPKYEKAVALLTTKFKRLPEFEEIARYLNIPFKRLTRLELGIRALRLSHNMRSIDNEYQDKLEDKREINPVNKASLSELEILLMNSIDSIKEKRDREIIKMRYGLDGYSPESLEAIGKKLNLTKEGVRQIEKRALEKLRVVLYNTAIKPKPLKDRDYKKYNGKKI